MSGFAMAWDTSTTSAGSHTLYVQVRSTCGWVGVQRTVSVGSGGAVAAVPPAQGPVGGVPPTLTPNLTPSPAVSPTLGSPAPGTPTIATTPGTGTPGRSDAAAGQRARRAPDARPGWRWTSDGIWISDITNESFRGGQLISAGAPLPRARPRPRPPRRPRAP